MTKIPIFTVLIPTFNHGKTLLYSIESVRRQTIQDFKIFVVGDGVPDVTREVMQKLCSQDERIHFFDNPKGEHQGELHRRNALKSAKSDYVAYLADDDLWFPYHLETILVALKKYSFVNTLATSMTLDEKFQTQFWLTQKAEHRNTILTKNAGFGTSFGAHTMELYNKIKEPWSIAPSGVNTDVSFWRTLLRHPDCNPFSILKPTGIRFAAEFRKEWNDTQKEEELKKFLERLNNPLELQVLSNRIIEDLFEILLKEIEYRNDEIAQLKSTPWAKIVSWVKEKAAIR